MPIPKLNGHGALLPNGEPCPTTSLELCQRFGTTPASRTILRGFLDLRAVIRGPLADEVDEQTAVNWNLHLTRKHTLAMLKRLTVSTHTGDKKLSCELLGLKASGTLPAKPAIPPKK
jgi:hypothetical protein